MVRRRYNLSFPCDDPDAMRAYNILRGKKIHGINGTELVVAALLAFVDGQNAQADKQMQDGIAKEISNEVIAAILPYLQQLSKSEDIPEKIENERLNEANSNILEVPKMVQEPKTEEAASNNQVDLTDALDFLTQFNF